MNIADLLIFKEIGDIEKLLVAQQVAINERFDRLEKLIVQGSNYVKPELEQAVKKVAAMAAIIDNKVKG